MSEGNVLDYVKVFVRSRLMLQTGVNPEEGVAIPNFETLLQDLPFFIRKAIVELQQVKLIPPSELAFVSVDRKREMLTPGGEVRYNYYTLPDDFASVEDFVISGYSHQPKYADNEFQLRNVSLIQNRTMFTVIQAENESGEMEHRLILEPFPDDDKEVYITYWVDGTNVTGPGIKERYWDAILSVVMRDMGLIDSFSASDQINTRIHQERHPQGNSSKTGSRPTVVGSFFTNTSRKVRSTIF